jgi:hypothetical protein
MVVFENVVRDFLFFLSSATNYLIRDLFSIICILIVFRLISQNRISFTSKSEKYFYLFILFQCIFLPLYSGFLAYLNDGQPILYGMLAERGRLVSVSVLVIYSYLKSKRISLKDINSIIIKLAWICLFSYLVIRALYEIVPTIFLLDMVAFEKGLTIIDPRTIETKGGVIMRVGLVLLVYAIIHYLLEFLNKKRVLSLFKIALFLSFIIFINKGRGVLAYLIITMLIIYWQNTRIKGKLTSLLLSIVAFFFLSLSNNADNNNQGPSLISSYTNILEGFNQVAKGNTTSDDMESSTWARVYSLGEVSKSFSSSSLHWIFGNGRLSYQFNDGFKGKVSEYFFPEDIGIAGAIYLYGIFTLLAFKMVYVYIYKYFKPYNNDDKYIITMRYFILYFFLISITAGADIMGSPEILVLFLAFATYNRSIIYNYKSLNVERSDLLINDRK